ncbi:MAG: hypothetical protein WC289_00885 [Patescibacteria group bacterium]|jgi:hypothetical protein
MALLAGLQKIDRLGLPHPIWEFVRSAAKLETYKKTKAYAGWTVRTVELKGKPWKSMYVNHITASQVPGAVRRIQQRQGGGAIIAVYPSWYWRRGGTMLVEKNRIVVETVRGHISELVRMGAVDGRFEYMGGKWSQIAGRKNVLSVSQQRQLKQAAKKITMRNILLEWSFSTQNKLIFYRLDDMKTVGKLLLQKYG